ncbi:MAG: hypothetical protein ACI35S_05520 [Anaeroplasma sp.]
MNSHNLEQESCSCNYIKETISKIDKMQKEIVSDTSYRCISCNSSLFSNLYNTIPISLYTCCGNSITGLIGAGGDETQYFRVESIRCGRFVTLRLLEATTVEDVTTLTGTDYTLIVDLDCIGRIQCFNPINVEVCTASDTTN